MIVPDDATIGRQVEGFIFRWLYLYSDSYGASLGGYTFTLILVARHDRARRRNDWEAGEGFIFRWLYLYSDSHGASLGGYTFALILVARHDHTGGSHARETVTSFSDSRGRCIRH